MSSSKNIVLKSGIWVYFLLLIFEGALRKWVLPELSNQLLLIRDPLVLYLFLIANRNKVIFFNRYLFYVFFIAIIGFISSIFLGHGNLIVSVYGFRIFAIHLPMIFLIGKVFTEEDVLKIGNAMLWISIPMAALIIAQFYSPQTAWVNRGLGGDLNGAGFSGAMGYKRPPGTFSFTSGTTSFFSLLAVFVFYFWVRTEKINRGLLVAATISLIVSIPFSISRTLLFEVIFSFLFLIIGVGFLRSENRKSAYLISGLALITIALTFLDFFTIGIEVFFTRFENANQAEGGIESVFLDRYLGGLIDALVHSNEQPFLGYGLGYGTNVGSFLITSQRTFLVSEGEWGRLIGELGPLLGIGMILIRVTMTIKLMSWSWKALQKEQVLPWAMLSITLLVLPQGGWAQPTSLGFCTLISGLVIASFSSEKKEMSLA